MRLLATTILSLGLSAGAASAAIYTGTATFTNVSYGGDTSLFLDAFGVDVTVTSAPDLTLHWTYDEGAVTTGLEIPVSTSDLAYDYRYHYGLDFSVQVGGGAPVDMPEASPTSGWMEVRDGTYDAPGGSDYVLDGVEFYSSADAEIGSTGVNLDTMYFYTFNRDEGAIDGTDLPTAQEFAALNAGSTVDYGEIRLRGRDGASGKITYGTGYSYEGEFLIAAVPLPASVAVLGLGLLGLGAWRRAQRRA